MQCSHSLAVAAAGNPAAACSPFLNLCNSRRLSRRRRYCCSSNAAAAAAAAAQAERCRRRLPPSTGALCPPLRRPRRPSTAYVPLGITGTDESSRETDGYVANANSFKDNERISSSSSRDGKRRRGAELCAPADILRLMDVLQLPVDEDLYVSLVKECTESRDAAQGAHVHSHLRRSNHHFLRSPTDMNLANRLLLMYAACGLPESARLMFDQMPSRDATSWVTMVLALFTSQDHCGALQLFAEMCAGDHFLVAADGCLLNVALVTVLESCAQARELALGQQVHALALKVMIEGCGAADSRDVGSSLVQFYSTLCHHESAAKVLARTRSPDIAVWTCTITGHCRRGQFNEAVGLFREMGRAGWRRNRYALSSTLAACARMADRGWSGVQVHACAIKLGASSDPFVGSSLVDMYVKHQHLTEARKAFAAIKDGTRDAVCWNALLAGYTREVCSEEAIKSLLKDACSKRRTVKGINYVIGV